MRELFELADKYGFKAPLASLGETFDIKQFARLAASLDISETSISVVTSVFLELNKIDEGIASLEYIAHNIGKTPENVRHHLQQMVKQGFVEPAWVTTDPVKRRRGKLFQLTIPKKLDLSVTQVVSPSDFQLVPSNQVERMLPDIDGFDFRVIHNLVVRFLVKAMRTNRKDKCSHMDVAVINSDGSKTNVVSEAEGNRLMYVLDISYYTGALTWLYTHIDLLLSSGSDIPETYTLPLDELVSLCKFIPLSESSSGGYIDNAIEALRRISASTFTMNNLPIELKEFHQSATVDWYFKLFRLEAVVSFEQNDTIKKAARVQFPKHIVDAVVRAVKEESRVEEFMLIDETILSTRNEIEILFGLWARDLFNRNAQYSRSFSWNELREVIAPSSTLNEFKRKFSAIIASNADPEYTPKLSPEAKSKVSEVVDNVIYTGKGESRSLLYGRATVHGFLVNIGFSPETGTVNIFFRKDLTGLLLTPRGRLKLAPTA